MTQTLIKINIRVQYIRYTSEYIPKLQLHQHSLLTRKVFSRHNLSAQVFFSVLSGSSSSPCHLHLQVIFTWIWIITWSLSSSLDLNHPSIWIISGASSLDLYQPLIWIISAGSSILNLHRCYLMILLVIGISTDPALFHVGCRPIQHVGLRPVLTYDHVGTNPIIISERKRPTLTYDHVVTNPTTLSRKAQHLHLINQWSNKGTTLTLGHVRN